MDRPAFARLALERVRRARPDDAFILDEGAFAIVGSDKEGKSLLHNLGNFYDEYLHAPPEERERVLERLCRFGGLIDSKESLDEVRVLLMPRLRPRRYFECDRVRMVKSIPGADPSKLGGYTPFADHLGIALAIDRPEHVEYVAEPAKFGVPAEELDAIALSNLRRISQLPLKEVRPGFFLGNWGDEYAAERMLVPELWDGLAVNGDPVVFLPGSERIYVVGSNDEAGLELALKMVDERLAKPRGLCALGFVRRDGAWRVFEPGGALGRELGDRLTKSIADTYAQQREELDEALPLEMDEPPFVPNLMGIMGAGGELVVTITTWTDGVFAYLPRAHRVVFGRLETGEMADVTWQDAMELAGHLLEPVPGLYPPRWATKGFPDDAAYAAIKARDPKLAASRKPVAAPARIAPRGTDFDPDEVDAFRRSAKPGAGRVVFGIAIVLAAVLALLLAAR